MSAFGATPGATRQLLPEIVVALYGPAYVDPSARMPDPAAVPATCEPWPTLGVLLGQSSGFGSGCGTG